MTSGKEAPTAVRMRLLQEVLEYPSCAAFAAFLDISTQRLWNYQNGTPIPVQMAMHIVRKVPGLTLDWIYFGKPDGLTLVLARRLDCARTTRAD
jgi:hypothetical protein